MSVKNFFLGFLILFSILNKASAQKEFVEFKTRTVAPLRKFEYHQPSNFEVVNGRFNAAINSANGYTFEINNIPAKLLKCKTKLNGSQFKVVMIDNRTEKTYVSQNDKKATLTINCLPNGDFELQYTGEIFRDKIKVNVSATLVGKVNHSRNVKTIN